MASTSQSGSSRRKPEAPGRIRLQLREEGVETPSSEDIKEEDDRPAVDYEDLPEDSQPKWKCYLCDKNPLQGLREDYKKIRDTLKKVASKGAISLNQKTSKESPHSDVTVSKSNTSQPKQVKKKSEVNGDHPTTTEDKVNGTNNKTEDEVLDKEIDKLSKLPTLRKRQLKDRTEEGESKDDRVIVEPNKKIVKLSKLGPESSKKNTNFDDLSSDGEKKDESEQDDETNGKFFVEPLMEEDDSNTVPSSPDGAEVPTDAITAMSLQELSDFPLDDFFDHYLRGLRRMVSNFQTEASMRKRESQEAKSKLVAVRKLIAKLLKSTSPNKALDIDPEESGDKVDELLAACVRGVTGWKSRCT